MAMKRDQALLTAAKSGDTARIARLLRPSLFGLIKPAALDCRDDPDHRTPLHWAAANGHKEAVAALLDHGADHSLGDFHGLRPIIDAASGGHLDVVELLLTRGAAVDVANGQGFTALILAADNGHVAIVRRLLAAGADVHVANRGGDTALTCAACEGHQEIVTALLEKGADVEHVNSKKQTALLLAAGRGMRRSRCNCSNAATRSRGPTPRAGGRCTGRPAWECHISPER